MKFQIHFALSEFVTTPVLNQLRTSGLGTLRITAGIPKSNGIFFKAEKKEDDTLPGELFKSGARKDFLMKTPSDVTMLKKHWLSLYEVDLPIKVGVGAESQGACGLLLQWSKIQEFESKNPVFMMSVTGVW